MPIRSRFLPASLLVLLALTPAAHASPDDRRTLVLRGRVTDETGGPVAKARVVARGSHRASVTVDDAGQFELTLALGTARDLARRPMTVRVRAERPGWRLGLPSGDADLGIGLGIVAGDSGVARCEARSNRADVTAAIMRALTADGDATAVAVVNFLGIRGDALESPAELGLSAVDGLAVRGIPVPEIREEPQGSPGSPDAAHEVVEPEAKPSKKKADHVEAIEAGEKPSKKKPRREPERGESTVSASPPATPSPGDAERELAEAKRRQEKERSLAREAAKRAREEAQKRDRMQRRTLEEEKARTTREQQARGSAEDELLRGREAEEKRWSALRQDVQMIAGSTDTTSAPPVGSLAGLAGTPARPEHRGRAVTPRLTAPRDTVSVPPPRALPEPPPVAAPAPKPARDAGATRPSTPPAPATPARDAGTTPSSTPARESESRRPLVSGTSSAGAETRPLVTPSPEAESRARARPLVIRAPGPGASVPNATRAVGDSCSCRIEGTVEVDSEWPLASRTRVVVSLVWYPAIADTVELFMGSPRGFSLPPAPCGPQRLRVVSIGPTRYDVVSRAAMAGFRCESGARRQHQIVLQPR
jgi:hypothetical protein